MAASEVIFGNDCQDFSLESRFQNHPDSCSPWTSCQISCTIALFSFITLVLEPGVHMVIFIPKCLVSVTFARIATSSLARLNAKNQKQLQNFSDFSQ